MDQNQIDVKHKILTLIIQSASLHIGVDLFQVIHVSEVVIYRLKTKIKN